jgi:hypothetical protein
VRRRSANRPAGHRSVRLDKSLTSQADAMVLIDAHPPSFVRKIGAGSHLLLDSGSPWMQTNRNQMKPRGTKSQAPGPRKDEAGAAAKILHDIHIVNTPTLVCRKDRIFSASQRLGCAGISLSRGAPGLHEQPGCGRSRLRVQQARNQPIRLAR